MMLLQGKGKYHIAFIVCVVYILLSQGKRFYIRDSDPALGMYAVNLIGDRSDNQPRYHWYVFLVSLNMLNSFYLNTL